MGDRQLFVLRSQMIRNRARAQPLVVEGHGRIIENNRKSPHFSPIPGCQTRNHGGIHTATQEHTQWYVAFELIPDGARELLTKHLFGVAVTHAFNVWSTT